MIGVTSREDEMGIVEEFFQLFKTPWEFCVEGHTYDVVVSTRVDNPGLSARLSVIYGSTTGHVDEDKGVAIQSRQEGGVLQCNGVVLPIYGSILTFQGEGRSLLRVKGSSEPAGVEINGCQAKTLRIGYDLFQEVSFLLSSGQPSEMAGIPTLEIHISMLRNWILEAGVPLVEVPPTPAGYEFTVCLTHDVDFIGIRRHKLDHSTLGFLHRALLLSLMDALRRKASWSRLLQNWKAVFSLPGVYLGLVDDFWWQFDRYLAIERDLSSTFFLIPFKNRAGDRVCGKVPGKRATRYDVDDVKARLQDQVTLGYEIGLHGIDAWHHPDRARQELERISSVTGQSEVGVRMHWLYFNERSPLVLEEAGFCYDSTVGYNDAVGYRAGTTQVFRPLGAKRLLELPMHIQDTAMFYNGRMNLSEPDALNLCRKLFRDASLYGGVLTVNWHQRSLGPERLWGDFYVELLEELSDRSVWFANARQVVEWFRRRRALHFDEVRFTGNSVRLKLRNAEPDVQPGLTLRVHHPGVRYSLEPVPSPDARTHVDVPLTGETEMEISL
jgi:hypothetical protein